MLIPSVYISYRRRNKRWTYFKLKKKHVDEPTFEGGISRVEKKIPIPPENDDSDSETEYDGEGLSFKDINNVVNKAVNVVKHPVTKLVHQAVDVIKYPATKLVHQIADVVKYPVNKWVNQVEPVIKHPEDILQQLVPVKGAGFTNDEDQMTDNDANSDDAELDDGVIEDEWMEPDAKVTKIGDFQRVDDGHAPSSIPPTENKKYPTRKCRVCTKLGIRRESRYCCKDCSDTPALCKACFNDYHV